MQVNTPRYDTAKYKNVNEFLAARPLPQGNAAVAAAWKNDEITEQQTEAIAVLSHRLEGFQPLLFNAMDVEKDPIIGYLMNKLDCRIHLILIHPNGEIIESLSQGIVDPD